MPAMWYVNRACFEVTLFWCALRHTMLFCLFTLRVRLHVLLRVLLRGCKAASCTDAMPRKHNCTALASAVVTRCRGTCWAASGISFVLVDWPQVNAFAVLRYKPPPLLQLVEQRLSAALSTNELAAGQLAGLAKDFATMQHDPGALLAAVADALAPQAAVRGLFKRHVVCLNAAFAR